MGLNRTVNMHDTLFSVYIKVCTRTTLKLKETKIWFHGWRTVMFIHSIPLDVYMSPEQWGITRGLWRAAAHTFPGCSKNTMLKKNHCFLTSEMYAKSTMWVGKKS